MKILSLAHCYLPLNRGGAELMLHRVLSRLVREGHDVTVAVTEDGPRGAELDLDGVRVRYVEAKDELRKNPDRIVTHLKNVSVALSYRRQFRVPVVVLCHSDHKWIMMDLAKKPDVTVFNTQWVRDSVLKRLRLSESSLVLHPPVDPGPVYETPGHFVTLVNPLPEKGSDTFYAVAKALPNVPFLVVEGGYEHRRQEFRPLPNVSVQPHTKEMHRDVYSRTKVLLMPSHFESYGMVAVEAATSGIPVVAAPTPGLMESLGGNATYLPHDSFDLWIGAVEKLTGDAWHWGLAQAEALRVRDLLEERDNLDRVVESILRGRVSQ